MPILKVNGIEHSIDAPVDVPLLWILREELGLTGTKYSCGKSLCGSCTIHINGKARRSCVTPVSAALDQEVTTIEGILGDDGEPHAIQRIWAEENVPQCGYCQSGQIMSALLSSLGIEYLCKTSSLFSSESYFGMPRNKFFLDVSP